MMKVNVYDFDKTIYDGDSSIDFYLFCLKKDKSILFSFFRCIVSYLLYIFKVRNKKEVKEMFFQFLAKIDDIDQVVNDFWKQNKSKIKNFYMNQETHKKDIIISASPEFLLKPICLELKVYDLIASKIDKQSGKFLSENCKGKEKVNRLYQKYNDIKVEKVYTDSRSDQPLLDIARVGYIVKKDKIKLINKDN